MTSSHLSTLRGMFHPRVQPFFHDFRENRANWSAFLPTICLIHSFLLLKYIASWTAKPSKDPILYWDESVQFARSPDETSAAVSSCELADALRNNANNSANCTMTTKAAGRRVFGYLSINDVSSREMTVTSRVTAWNFANFSNDYGFFWNRWFIRDNLVSIFHMWGFRTD